MKTNKRAKLFICLWSVLTLSVTVFCTSAFADGDPLTIVNNLSDFIFSAIKAIGNHPGLGHRTGRHVHTVP